MSVVNAANICLAVTNMMAVVIVGRYDCTIHKNNIADSHVLCTMNTTDDKVGLRKQDLKKIVLKVSTSIVLIDTASLSLIVYREYSRFLSLTLPKSFLV